MVARIRPAGARRLAGIRFEAQPPPLTEILPRMDIAVFVGFAAAGPLHVPIAVEDLAQFAAVFGADAPLVWDATSGELVYAQLGPAVRAFFRNGGTRCWVIRVADEAQSQVNFLPIPGLAEVRPGGKIVPAFARARAVGSWSDGLRVSSALTSQRVELRRGSLRTRRLDLIVGAADTPRVGSLLRCAFVEGFVVFMPIAAIQPGPTGSHASSIPRRTIVRVTGARAIWFEQPREPRISRGVARIFTPSAARRLATAFVPPGTVWQRNQPVVVDLQLNLADAPALGSTVRINFGPDQLWLTVEQVATAEYGSPPLAFVRVTGSGLFRRRGAPRVLPRSRPTVELLSFELWVREGAAAPVRMTDLQFAAEHEHFWGTLPTDDQLYAPPPSGVSEPPPAIWAAAAEPRFPLAGNPYPNAVYVPLGMGALPQQYLAPVGSTATSLERDGLAQFDARLFMDRDLCDVGTANLLNAADFLRYLATQPRPLRGLHAALAIDEATLIAVPDAVQRGWTPAPDGPEPEPPDPSPPMPRPEWWSFLPCNLEGQELADTLRRFTPSEWHAYLDAHPEVKVPLTSAPEWEYFLHCGLQIVPAPVLQAQAPDSRGTFELRWSSTVAGERRFVLQEAQRRDWSDAAEIYTGDQQALTLYGRSQGEYFYRVRVETVEERELYLQQRPSVDDGGQALETLLWEAVPAADAVYTLQRIESDPLTLAVRSSSIYSGTATLFTFKRPTKAYSYRLTVRYTTGRSDWSRSTPQVVVRIAPASRWQQRDSAVYEDGTLLAVQRAVLRLCAARGDMLAVLAMPEHFREDRSLEHVAVLKSPVAAAVPVADRFVRPLSVGEAHAFSFGALYHPWLLSREAPAAPIRRSPPDGAACGMIAARSARRGAWIAPANEPLGDVLALTPRIDSAHWQQLLEAQLNTIRHEPRGFVALSADTLSDDPDLRPINVRRLLSLLRRMALKHGATYVFEPNSDEFRRLVQRNFDALLGYMFERGAFAGRTRAEAFRVVTDRTVNPPAGVDQGRFVIELRVAPSLPLTFLTVRLVQAGEHNNVSEGR